MPRKTKGDAWDNLFLSVLCVLAFPLLPILFEFTFSSDHSIKEDSVLLAAAMYIIGVGLTSKLRSYFFATLLASLFSAVAYGIRLHAFNSDRSFIGIAWLMILGTACLHLLERIYRHIMMREQFFEWES
jgi:hypothetical protein